MKSIVLMSANGLGVDKASIFKNNDFLYYFSYRADKNFKKQKCLYKNNRPCLVNILVHL